MAKFKFGKFETEIDGTDVDFTEEYDAALTVYRETVGALEQNPPAAKSEQLAALCNVFFVFFDSLFGDDTHEKMFGQRRSVAVCADAFMKLTDCIENDNGMQAKVNAFIGNRAQRRANQ